MINKWNRIWLTVLVIALVVTLIPNARADVFPTKNYNETTKTYEIRDWFGLGEWIGLGDNYDVQQISNTDICDTRCNTVERYYFYDTYTVPENMKGFETKFYNSRGGLRKVEYNYEIRKEEEYECVIEWRIEKKIEANSSITETRVPDKYGTCVRNYYEPFEWAGFTFEKDTDYYIRLNVKKNHGENIDWKLTIDNAKLDKWSWQNSSGCSGIPSDYLAWDDGDTTIDGTAGSNLETLETGGWDETGTALAIYSSNASQVYAGSLGIFAADSAKNYYIFDGDGVLNGTLEFWMYDTLATSADFGVELWNAGTRIGIFGMRDSSDTHYGGYFLVGGAITFNKARTRDWHKFAWHWEGDAGNFSIDGVEQDWGMTDMNFDNVTAIGIWYQQGGENMSLDNIRIYNGTQCPLVVGLEPTIHSPTNTTYDEFVLDFKTTVVNTTPIDQHIYELNGVNTSFTPNTTITGISGSNVLKYYVNDTNGLMNVTSVVFTIAPILSPHIHLPTNTTYNSTAALNFKTTVINSSAPIDQHIYELNGVNTSFTPNTTITGISGSNVLKYYVNNTDGIMNVTSVVFSIDITNPTINLIVPATHTLYESGNMSINITTPEANPSTYVYSLNGAANITFIANTSINISQPTNNMTVCMNDTSNNWGCSATHKFHVGNITKCVEDSQMPSLNFSIRDEGNSSLIPATLDIDLTFWVSNYSINKTYSYEGSGQYNYSFCINPNWTSVNLSYELTAEATGYPLKHYEASSLSLTNTTTQEPLYLLQTDDGIYVTFQVLNSASQPIGDVHVTAEKQISGTWEVVGIGDTDAAGAVTFWLDPNYPHNFNFTKAGYDDYRTTITPTQSSYTVILGGEVTVNETNYNLGINYTFNPTDITLNNNTNYVFSFNITSSYWALDSYGFILKNKSGSILGSASGTTETGGIAQTNVNTGNQTYVVMNYFWEINNTYMNGSKTWFVQYTYEGDFSLKYFFDDLIAFSETDIGDGGFTMSLIAFAAIFLITGIVCYTSGTYSSLFILGLITALTAFFDFVGMISPVGNIDHFVTVLMFTLFFSYIIYEHIK